jgi:hypothetical protein
MKLLLIALLFPLFAYAESKPYNPSNPNFFGPSQNTATSGGNTTNIDQSDSSQAGVYLETLSAPSETVGNVTCGGVTYGIDTIKQEKGDVTGVFRVAYAPPSKTCSDTMKLQKLQETGKAMLLCRQLRNAGETGESANQGVKELMALCQ